MAVDRALEVGPDIDNMADDRYDEPGGAPDAIDPISG